MKWEAAAGWRWDAKEEDICGMCRSAFEVSALLPVVMPAIGNFPMAAIAIVEKFFRVP